MTDPMIERKVILECKQTTSEEEAWVKENYKKGAEKMVKKEKMKNNDDDGDNNHHHVITKKTKQEHENDKGKEEAHDETDILARIGLVRHSIEPLVQKQEDVSPLPLVLSLVADPFTCFIQELFGRINYGNNLPKEEPNKKSDSMEMYNDKIFYHRAATNAKIFNDELLVPHIKKLAVWIREKTNNGETIMCQFLNLMLLCNEMLVEPLLEENDDRYIDAWTNQKVQFDSVRLILFQKGEPVAIHVAKETAEFLKSVHNIYHFEHYIVASLIENVKQEDVHKKTLVDAWATIVTDDLALVPVSEWYDLTCNTFVDCMIALYKVWIQSYALFQQQK